MCGNSLSSLICRDVSGAWQTGPFSRSYTLPSRRPDPMTCGVISAPWRPLVRTLCATAGRSAAQRALPLYLGLWIVASVLLEGNGVRPADVVARLNQSTGERALAYGAWTIVSLP